MRDARPDRSPTTRRQGRGATPSPRTAAARLGAAALVAGLLLASAADATDGPQLGADEVMRNVNARPRGPASRASLRMTLHAARGDNRKDIVSERERAGDGYRTVYWITTPEHERGIGLLLSEDSRQAGMWMHFPAAKQTVHVVSRGLPALASDFSCEDLLVEVPLADYRFRILGHEVVDGIGTYRVEMKPASERLASELGFANAIGWVRDDIWMIVRADYLDDTGVVFKTFSARDVRQIQGIWTARTLAMENRRAHHSTRVDIVDIAYADRLDGGALALQGFGKGFEAAVK